MELISVLSNFTQTPGWAGCVPSEDNADSFTFLKTNEIMFDRRVVVVPSAGRPPAVPLWVPALRAGGLRRRGDGEWSPCLTPACHLTWFCSVRGMFTRVCTTVTWVLQVETLQVLRFRFSLPHRVTSSHETNVTAIPPKTAQTQSEPAASGTLWVTGSGFRCFTPVTLCVLVFPYLSVTLLWVFFFHRKAELISAASET